MEKPIHSIANATKLESSIKKCSKFKRQRETLNTPNGLTVYDIHAKKQEQMSKKLLSQ
jgi:hypothetical protein